MAFSDHMIPIKASACQLQSNLNATIQPWNSLKKQKLENEKYAVEPEI
jgi:hypothetical protein